MMAYRAKVIPVQLFPGEYCLVCLDPEHPGRTCYLLEYHHRQDGVAIEPCGCDTSVTADSPGKYVVRVIQLQKE